MSEDLLYLIKVWNDQDSELDCKWLHTVLLVYQTQDSRTVQYTSLSYKEFMYTCLWWTT